MLKWISIKWIRFYIEIYVYFGIEELKFFKIEEDIMCG